LLRLPWSPKLHERRKLAGYGRTHRCKAVSWRTVAGKLLRVLSFAVSEGPVLLADLDKTDKHVLATQLHTLLQSIGNGLVERFFLLDRSTVVECDLNEVAIGRTSDNHVAGVDDELPGWV